MNAVGRPTSYRSEFCELASNYCLLGATNVELAGFFDVAPRTIDYWIARIPEFAAAVLEGRAVADSRVARGLYQRAVGYDSKVQRTVLWRGEERTLTRTVHHPPDIRACIFWLRNRRRQDWTDRPGPRTAEEDQVVAQQDVEPVNSSDSAPADFRSTGAQGPHGVVAPEQIEQGPERPATLGLQVGIALDDEAGV